MSVCPCCGKEMVPCCSVPGCKDHVEVYSRPCGYLTPVSHWNDGKQAEFKDRAEYTEWGKDHIWYDKYKANYTDRANESITTSK